MWPYLSCLEVYIWVEDFGNEARLWSLQWIALLDIELYLKMSSFKRSSHWPETCKIRLIFRQE